jgi:hypothetical protein
LYRIKRRKKKQQQQQQQQAEEEEKKELRKSSLPQLHKQYQRYSTVDSIQLSGRERYYVEEEVPNEYDSVTLHDNTTPPRGFSFDHLVPTVTTATASGIQHQKPNQVKDQQPFIEGEQQQQQSSSIGSFYLHPISESSAIPTTPILPTTPSSLVKPSI